MAEGFAPTDEAILCLHAHEQDLDMRPWPAGKARMGPAHLKGDRHDGRFDRGDLHSLVIKSAPRHSFHVDRRRRNN